jgi:hypothetical protein
VVVLHISLVVAVQQLRHIAVAIVAEHSIVAERLPAVEVIAEQPVAEAAVRSIRVAITQLVTVVHSISAMITTLSVAHQAMEAAIREVTLAERSLQVVATAVVRADDSLV